MKLARTTKNTLIPQYRLYGDEAGRWPLAWPVTVGIILPLWRFDTTWFADSKQLTEKRRNTCYTQICQLENNGKLIKASGRATNKEIDHRGIIGALRQATIRAIYLALQQRYCRFLRTELLTTPHGENHLAVTQFDALFGNKCGTAKALKAIFAIEQSLFDLRSLLFDGNHDFGVPETTGITMTTIIKGDSKNAYISMASIVAKVERDSYMSGLSKRFNQYGFPQHNGYGTVKHRKAISRHGCSPLHRTSFCHGIKKRVWGRLPPLPRHQSRQTNKPTKKPDLLLHICCAPDLTRPLNWLKQHFKLHLFRYNPNIHPRKEHTKRYDQFLKLLGLEPGDYEILEDRYDPKEFFAAMVEQKTTIDESLKDKPAREVLQVAWEMEERSSRCNPCYQMRLDQAARMAAKEGIPYFTSTLLISPKKHGDKLFDRGIEGEKNNPGTKFLRFDFAKDNGYKKASDLTKKHKLRRQHYCGCWRTIPKPWETTTGYTGW